VWCTSEEENNNNNQQPTTNNKEQQQKTTRNININININKKKAWSSYNARMVEVQVKHNTHSTHVLWLGM
jgi:hypothetical protein